MPRARARTQSSLTPNRIKDPSICGARRQSRTWSPDGTFDITRVCGRGLVGQWNLRLPDFRYDLFRHVPSRAMIQPPHEPNILLESVLWEQVTEPLHASVCVFV